MANADEEYVRGVGCEEALRPAKALEHYLRALSLNPNHAPSLNNIGAIRQHWGQFDAAVAAYRLAIEANPRFGLAWFNLGNCHREQSHLDEAIDCYRRALALMPGDDETRINLANALREQRDLDEAVALLDAIPASSAHHSQAHFNRAMIHLLQGDLATGWDEYESRLHFGTHRRPIPAHRWNGAPLGRRSILVLSEQGIGDQVMFASCLPDLLKGTTTSFVECDPRLVPLFARSFSKAGFTAIPAAGDPAVLPAIDHCDVTEFLGTLPRFLRRGADDFPKKAGYLQADTRLVANWQKSLARQGAALNVGIAWHGGKDAETQRRRSIPLELWESIFRVAGVHFVNIQHGWAAAQGQQVNEQFGIALGDGSDCDPLSNLDDFAAKIAALDLVISVDNSTAHLAAALGKPVWTLLPHAADWRWMLDRESTPWYPTMRLLRCRAADDWAELLERAARLLAAAAGSRDFHVRAA